MKIGYYPCFVKLSLPASVSARTDCLNRAGIVAYGTARNWTTLLGIMTPVMGPRSAWWNVNVLGSLDSVAISLCWLQTPEVVRIYKMQVMTMSIVGKNVHYAWTTLYKYREVEFRPGGPVGRAATDACCP
jgi:hypothetical protein